MDVDLTLEGGGSGVSRLQCIIRLKHDGYFRIYNRGKRSIVVDGVVITHGGRHQ